MTAKRYSVSENIYEGIRAGASYTVVMEYDYAALEQRYGETALSLDTMTVDRDNLRAELAEEARRLNDENSRAVGAIMQRDEARTALAASDETIRELREALGREIAECRHCGGCGSIPNRYTNDMRECHMCSAMRAALSQREG